MGSTALNANKNVRGATAWLDRMYRDRPRRPTIWRARTLFGFDFN
jgi:hypothetical protein